jgi:hypothetical protein
VKFEFEKDSNSNSNLKLLSTISKALSLVLGRNPTLLRTRRPSPAEPQPNLTIVAFLYPSPTDGWGRPVSLTLSLPSSPFPHCSAAPHRPARATAACADGTVGPSSWHARRAQARPWTTPRESARGNAPIAPAGDATGTVAAIGGRPRRQAHSGGQSWVVRASLPLCRLTARLQHPGPSRPLASQAALGFFPSSSVCRRKGEREWRWEGGSCAPCAPRCRRRATAEGPFASTGESYRLTRRSQGRARRGAPSGTPTPRRLPRQSGNDYIADPA